MIFWRRSSLISATLRLVLNRRLRLRRLRLRRHLPPHRRNPLQPEAPMPPQLHTA
jgi:hypothetical protein